MDVYNGEIVAYTIDNHQNKGWYVNSKLGNFYVVLNL